MTTNHGYETPKKGTTDWHKPLNRNFDAIDRDVEIRDADAARENYEPKSGAKFLATDTEKVYIGDGSQWVGLSSVGKSPSFSSITLNGDTRTSWPGGSGNTIGAADAVVTLDAGTPATYDATGSQLTKDNDAGVVVQAAIDHLHSNGGGKIVVRSGSYTLETGITVKSNITVQGAGPGSTIFNCTGVEQEWSSASEGVKNVVLRDFRQDGNDSGYRTGINLTDAVDSWLINLDVRNVGDRADVGDSTPGLRVTGGTRSHIHNCRVERSTSVSIEAAIGAKACTITNCIVKNALYNSSVNFIHGISIEKSEKCKIQNCYIEDSGGSKASPALNANNADNAIVSGNTVRNAGGGLVNANGPCYANQYVNNNFYNCGVGINVKAGNAGAPKGTLIANNVFQNGGGINIGKDTSATIRNNLFQGVVNRPAIAVRNNPINVSIVGNVFREMNNDIMLINNTQTDEPLLIANNYADFDTVSTITDPIADIKDQYGIMTGNVWGTSATPDRQTATVTINPSATPSYWTVTNNYFRHASGGSGKCLSINSEGIVTHNQFDGGKLQGFYAGGSVKPIKAEVAFNHGTNNAVLRLPDCDNNPSFNESWARTASYTGDGTTGRKINISMTPDYLIVQGSDGTLYDVHTEFGTGFQQATPTGELSITDRGFTVGNNGGNDDPNVDGETYTFYAR